MIGNVICRETDYWYSELSLEYELKLGRERAFRKRKLNHRGNIVDR